MDLSKHRIVGIDDPYFQAMWKIYTEAFPLVEKRSFDDYAKALGDSACHLFVYLDANNEVQAILNAWDFPSSYFIEFYAIAHTARGKGLGTIILQDCMQKRQKKIVLEIEVVNDDATEKRWRFYKRLGFIKHSSIYVHPPYQQDFSTFNLNVLSFPEALDEVDYSKFIFEEKKIALKYSYYQGTIL